MTYYTYELIWVTFPFDELDKHYDLFIGNGLYFFTVWMAFWGEIQYIGKVVEQDFLTRLKQELSKERAKFEPFLISISYRTVSYGRLIQQRPSSQIISDLENLLIFLEQPQLNRIGKRSYNGRPIILKNRGDYKPLKEDYVYPI